MGVLPKRGGLTLSPGRGSLVHGVGTPQVNAVGSRTDLFADQPSDASLHEPTSADGTISRSWLEAELSAPSGSWRTCCRDLCHRLRLGGGVSDLSALERRQKAQEWSNVFSDSEVESGGLSSAPTDRSEEQLLELDVQPFQRSPMDARAAASSSTTRTPRVDVAQDGPMHLAAV
ncbi:hypothetical protein AB1Y20_018987 [Prymnesium parvum]|uniref:Uncharacterized protein n=1 Tax=Prymnesium parvum TaxID=97485 RepID=A0AB34JSW9_PRYPA